MTQISKFQFEGYKITKSIFDFDKLPTINNLKFGFKLSGIVNNEKKNFELKFGIHITNKSKSSHIIVDSTATYKYDDSMIVGKLEDLNDMFYLNSIALLFPHIRAYITALTSLSGNKTLILPTLNVSALKDDLKENIEIQ